MAHLPQKRDSDSLLERVGMLIGRIGIFTIAVFIFTEDGADTMISVLLDDEESIMDFIDSSKEPVTIPKALANKIKILVSLISIPHHLTPEKNSITKYVK